MCAMWCLSSAKNSVSTFVQVLRDRKNYTRKLCPVHQVSSSSVLELFLLSFCLFSLLQLSINLKISSPRHDALGFEYIDQSKNFVPQVGKKFPLDVATFSNLAQRCAKTMTL